LRELAFKSPKCAVHRPSCFNFAARRNGKVLLTRIAPEVGTFSQGDSRELKVIASRVSSASLVISQKTHGKPLRDDTVYSRYGVFAVNGKTAKNIALETAQPLIFAIPGGYSVEIDGS
jgi:predicted transcriptional regulator